MIKCNYGFLKAKIQEKCGNQGIFAEKLGISTQALSLKLNNKASFSHDQMIKSIAILGLTNDDLARCFFVVC